jgi:GrpB-like predicted nucleotidyltransferase (UPF0157 family)
VLVSDAVPAWAYEKAEILSHDPRLADRARAERARLARLLAPWLVDGREHVGSTAVPGLAAKPVIDLMASVRDPAVVVRRAGEQLARSYEDLKRRLARQHAGDREAYTDAKAEFVAAALRRAAGETSR